MKEQTKAVKIQSVPKPTIQRLPGYLNYLKEKQREGINNISATMIAEDLNFYHVQVRKDISYISSGGKPKTGYAVDDLIHDLMSFLGYGNLKEAVLVGAGKLGRTLLSYNGFGDYGLNISYAFDQDIQMIGTTINGKSVLSMDKLEEMCSRNSIHIGIITVPGIHAQTVCDRLVASGVKAIWNFAPVHLRTPDDIIIENENMAVSLAVLSNELRVKIAQVK